MSQGQEMPVPDPVVGDVVVVDVVVGDPIDQLVPPPRGRFRSVLLIAGVFIALGLAAVAPASGAVRPNLALNGTRAGSAGRGEGIWEYVLKNRGWTTATIEDFDLGLPGVAALEASLLPAEPVSGPVHASGTVAVAPGEEVLVRLHFTYDCARQGSRQRSTLRARGITPIWFVVDLGSGISTVSNDLADLIDAACSHAR